MSVARITLAGVQIEGNLLAADMTAELLAGNVKGQAPEDFGFTRTDKLADEIAIAWGDAKAYWAAFQRQLDRLDADDTATSVTRELWVVPLLRSLGYSPAYTAKAEVVEGQTYAISHRAELGENKPPIHIIGCRIKVDHRPPSGTPRLSAHALVQEYLNKTEHLWAIATNGYRWRLLRDSSLMTRLTYIEFDLEQILNGENFAEFGLFYRLFHRSRLPEGVDDADKCLLEYYHQEALQQGGRVRDRLRDGVEKALIQLGTGFLQHPSNDNLRQKLAAGTELTDIGYYRQLLRLIYRLLFLMVAESRNLLIGDDVEKARIYREYYSIERLRELAERPHWRREGFQDLWQGLRVTFLLFDENWRGKHLGLSPLNGDLFGSYTLPALFEQGGFNCVLGNPPWERIKLQEKEFFASQSAEIANAVNKAAREKLIKELPKKNPELAQAFEEAKHDAEAQSKFIRESGRFPLTAVGDINTYAVFSETVRNLISPQGRAGVIVPTGIATDDTTKKFFSDVIKQQSLVSLLGFTNWDFIFPGVADRFTFGLFNLAGKKEQFAEPLFVYHCHYISDLKQESRYFKLFQKDIELINPATLTCPIFRSEQDAKITRKIYFNAPILINDKTGYNPWGASFMRMFDMSNDSHLFSSDKTSKSLPLYEAKMFSIYDHRHGLYTEEMIDSNQNDFRIIPSPSLEQKQNHNFLVTPRYYIHEQAVNSKLGEKWKRNWLLCFRGISLAVNERTAIFSILPKVGVGNSAPVVLTDIQDVKLLSCLLANCCSLVFDFVARQKIGGANFNFFIVKQLPVLPPELYTLEDIKFISDRVLELVYTSWDMQPFAKDMGYDGEPFIWNPNRRALLRAELDAYYAKLYGLTRDELRYILDPADVYGADFPSETFRVLKNNEIKQFGEYRTQRLVLEAWDRMFK